MGRRVIVQLENDLAFAGDRVYGVIEDEKVFDPLPYPNQLDNGPYGRTGTFLNILNVQG